MGQAAPCTSRSVTTRCQRAAMDWTRPGRTGHCMDRLWDNCLVRSVSSRSWTASANCRHRVWSHIRLVRAERLAAPLMSVTPWNAVFLVAAAASAAAHTSPHTSPQCSKAALSGLCFWSYAIHIRT